MTQATRGNAIITRAGSARGGRYVDIPSGDIDIVNIDGLDLWFDHRSCVTRTGTMDLRDRVNGLPATLPGGVSLAPVGNAADDLGFQFETADAASGLIVPGYVLDESYWAVMAIKPANDGANVVRTLFRQNAATGPHAWILQAAVGENYQIRLRHQGAVLSGATAALALPPNVMSLVWMCYDNLRQRMAIGVNQNVVTTALGQEPHTGGTALGIFGAVAFGADSHFVGMAESCHFGSGDFYSADPASPVNTKRSDIIATIAARYGIAI